MIKMTQFYQLSIYHASKCSNAMMLQTAKDNLNEQPPRRIGMEIAIEQ